MTTRKLENQDWQRYFDEVSKNLPTMRVGISIMGEAMTRFLDGLPADKPFCLSVSFNVPHGSQTTSMYSRRNKIVAQGVHFRDRCHLSGITVIKSVDTPRKGWAT